MSTAEGLRRDASAVVTASPWPDIRGRTGSRNLIAAKEKEFTSKYLEYLYIKIFHNIPYANIVFWVLQGSLGGCRTRWTLARARFDFGTGFR
jgi:hypothetical protein